MIPVALLVTVGVFILVRLSPGDPALVFAGEERDPNALAAIREQMGLDQPIPVQYVVWLGHLAQGDLGRSFQTHQRVLEAVTERLPATLELGLAALLFSPSVTRSRTRSYRSSRSSGSRSARSSRARSSPSRSSSGRASAGWRCRRSLRPTTRWCRGLF